MKTVEIKSRKTRVSEKEKYALTSYEGLDENIVSLVKAMNLIDGIYTIDSCGGHKNPKSHQLPDGRWNVIFHTEHNKAGWLSLEFLVWFFNTSLIRQGYDVGIRPGSFAPSINEPGKCLYFVLQGEGVTADEIAEKLLKE